MILRSFRENLDQFYEPQTACACKKINIQLSPCSFVILYSILCQVECAEHNSYCKVALNSSCRDGTLNVKANPFFMSYMKNIAASGIVEYLSGNCEFRVRVSFTVAVNLSLYFYQLLWVKEINMEIPCFNMRHLSLVWLESEIEIEFKCATFLFVLKRKYNEKELSLSSTMVTLKDFGLTWEIHTWRFYSSCLLSLLRFSVMG